jgi:hypothetical protein
MQCWHQWLSSFLFSADRSIFHRSLLNNHVSTTGLLCWWLVNIFAIMMALNENQSTYITYINLHQRKENSCILFIDLYWYPVCKIFYVYISISSVITLNSARVQRNHYKHNSHFPLAAVITMSNLWSMCKTFVSFPWSTRSTLSTDRPHTDPWVVLSVCPETMRERILVDSKYVRAWLNICYIKTQNGLPSQVPNSIVSWSLNLECQNFY